MASLAAVQGESARAGAVVLGLDTVDSGGLCSVGLRVLYHGGEESRDPGVRWGHRVDADGCKSQDGDAEPARTGPKAGREEPRKAR